jgi:hypothetical protein
MIFFNTDPAANCSKDYHIKLFHYICYRIGNSAMPSRDFYQQNTDKETPKIRQQRVGKAKR